MSFFTIGNINNPPLNNINGSLANVDNSHVPIPFGSNVNPATVNPNALPLPGSNVLSAKGIIKGGSINRKKINKISRKYKMKGSNKTKRRHIRRIKSRVFKRYSTKSRHNKKSRSKRMRGGSGYTQFDNNKVISNNYATGSVVPNFTSAMANPVTYSKLNAEVDNLNHYAKNDYGHRVGYGTPSRGWF
jgi:hypothetical protein